MKRILSLAFAPGDVICWESEAVIGDVIGRPVVGKGCHPEHHGHVPPSSCLLHPSIRSHPPPILSLTVLHQGFRPETQSWSVGS